MVQDGVVVGDDASTYSWLGSVHVYGCGVLDVAKYYSQIYGPNMRAFEWCENSMPSEKEQSTSETSNKH